MSNAIKHLLILGCGYVGERLGRTCRDAGMQVFGTTRDAGHAEKLKSAGIEPLLITDPTDISADVLAQVDAVLDSIPLERSKRGMHAGQTRWLPQLVSRIPHVKWAGYLSTTGVYGDADGAWVDENWECRPSSERGVERLKAERAWLDSGMPAEIFRLAGIYGPGRNIIQKLQAGGYKAVRWQTPHFSSRIHVDDIVAALIAAMGKPRPGRIVNLADDMPLPHDEYVSELAAMIDAPAPILLSPEEGQAQLAPAALDFFRDNKRVANRLLHRELLPVLKYPSFRDAVPDLLRDVS
ncbi:MAG: SDR family oxidoreductase [Mariprofundaceae bacterium]